VIISSNWVTLSRRETEAGSTTLPFGSLERGRLTTSQGNDTDGEEGHKLSLHWESPQRIGKRRGHRGKNPKPLGWREESARGAAGADSIFRSKPKFSGGTQYETVKRKWKEAHFRFDGSCAIKSGKFSHAGNKRVETEVDKITTTTKEK